MKAVIQRVKNASVSVDEKTVGAIDYGLLVYLGVAENDSEKDACWLAAKIINLRIFPDTDGKMNLSLLELKNNNCKKIGVLAISQFTLLADAKKGRRPFYGEAAAPEKANALYNYFVANIKEKISLNGLVCETGIFQAHMEVSYTNDGPVTILLDTSEAGV
jgi:D-tyrosyl-tRNA(Tyr) deacylase